MRDSRPSEGALFRRAASQQGNFTRAQAHAASFNKDRLYRLLAGGRAERVLPGVFRFTAAPRTWEQQAMAALLWVEDGTLSHTSAARPFRIGGIASPLVEISGPRDRRSRDGIIYHRLEIPASEVAWMGDFRLTVPARTIVDLASCVDVRTLELALDDVLRRGLADLGRIERIRSREADRGRKGTRVLRSLLEDRYEAPLPESVLEGMLLKVLREGGLPDPARQLNIRSGGGLVARVDLAYPEQRIVIEADGYAFHSTKPDWQRDRDRQNALEALGWKVIRITWDQVTRRPHEVVLLVQRLMDTSRARREGYPSVDTGYP